MLAGEVVAVEANESRARELAENLGRLGRDDVRVVHADGRDLPPDLTGFDRALVDAPCSGLGVLASRPDLRWRSQPLPELQLELLRAAADRVRPGGTIVYSVCTINADEAEAVVDASGLDVEPIEGWAAVPAPDAAGVPPDLSARARHERLLRRPSPRAVVGSPRGLARLGADGRDRAVAVCGGLLAISPIRFSRCCTPGARIFHFDVGDGHFVPPVTIGPVVLRSIAPHIHDVGGRIDCHLMVDDPAHHFQEIAESGGDSVTFHVEAVEDVSGVIAQAREHGLEVGVAFNPETPVEVGAEAANLGADLCLCMSIKPGYSGQEFMEDAYERLARTRELVDCFVQVDGGVKAENVRAAHDAGADLLVVGTGIFGFDCRRIPWAARMTGVGSTSRPGANGACAPCDEPRAGARARSGCGRTRVSEADGRRGRRRATAKSWARARPRRTAATVRSSRSRRPASAPAAPRST